MYQDMNTEVLIVGEHVLGENDLRSRNLPADTIVVGIYGMTFGAKTLTGEKKSKPQRHRVGNLFPQGCTLN